MGPIGCPETSLTNYQSTLRNIPKSEDFIHFNIILPSVSRSGTLYLTFGFSNVSVYLCRAL